MKFLIVSTMPPESTGVAEFTASIFSDNEKFKILSTKDSDLQKFYSYAAHQDFEIFLFVLGNSNHNLPVLRVLMSLQGFPGIRKKIFIQVHDPVISNIAMKYCSESSIDYFQLYSKSRGEPLERETGDPHHIPSCIFRAWKEKHIAGWLPIVQNLNVHTYITHSSAASKILSQEFALNKIRNPRILQLFHPCFTDPYSNLIYSRLRTYDVGVFGVLDNGGKCSDIALRAILNAKKGGLINSAIFAGYNAQNYFNSIKFDTPKWIKIVDQPSNEELIKLMAQTSVAVQLRRENTGESSGIIPQLISTGTLPIVSEVGSFLEFPKDLVFTSSNNENDLLKKIEFALQKKEVSVFEMSREVIAKKFLESINPKIFIDSLINYTETHT